MLVEPLEDAALAEADILAWLTPRVAKWWLPDRVVFDKVPLTATGKIDKKVIRERFKDILRD